MIFQYMKRIITFIFFCAITSFANGQQIHFVYLQTENGQPFYVKLDNNNVTSSSSLGYLILPKLSDGDYNITVGFPKKEFPEEKFKLSIDKKNEGFLLKNFGDNGWGLFNLQSFSVVMGTVPDNTQSTAKNIQSDPFSTMLATVVKDSSILEKPNVVLQDAPKKKDTISTVDVVKDTPVSVVQNDHPVLLSTITRTLFKKSKDGIEMIYIDKLDSSDTIRVFIPRSTLNDKEADTISNSITKEDIKNDSAAKEVLKAQESSVQEQEKNISSEQAIDSSKEMANVLPQTVSEPQPTDSVQSQKNISGQNPVSDMRLPGSTSVPKVDKIIKEKNNKKEDIPKVVEFSKLNSDCKAFASNDDFLKLRKKIAGENSNDNMLKEAKKGFRSKCFSTEQIKNLSFLFLDDEGKYQFFDAAYAFTSDSDQYYKLQSQLSDPYYINRFKAMIHK